LNKADLPTFGRPTMAISPDMTTEWLKIPVRERQKLRVNGIKSRQDY